MDINNKANKTNRFIIYKWNEIITNPQEEIEEEK